MTQVKVSERVALYGGSFDPPHNGHMATVALLLNSLLVDRVIVVPSGERPDKTKATAAVDRLAMTRIAVDEAFPSDTRVSVSDVHAIGAAAYGTVDLLDCMRVKESQAEFWIVIGSELVPALPTWRESIRLAASAHFLVVQRPGAAAPDAPAGFRLQRVPSNDPWGILISSTHLRVMISKGESCAGFVSKAVAAFISQRSLYLS
jgi:nicotinate-nucleotide adenylyltransferase